ncbi:MAG: dihydropteroate synthase [Bacteroidetes bacterium]|nr:dihydropteroate synthase [Bacteroidota bacterium]
MIGTLNDRRPLKIRDRILDSGSRCLLMGILNVTPDSFSDGGAYAHRDAAVEHALGMCAAGADIIDIGGESTRPGAAEISESEEMDRVLPVIAALRACSEVPISVDTRHAAVAEAAIHAGADIVNDVSALRHDPLMAGVAARGAVPVVLMHMQGNPETMQHAPDYDNVVEEVNIFFEERIAFCRAAGITQLLLDPGIGFGKTVEHNLALLRGLGSFRHFGYPLLVGTSRKSFIGAVTGAAVDDRLPGSIASGVLAYMNGARILRVHDVRPMRAALDVAEAIAHGEVQHAF